MIRMMSALQLLIFAIIVLASFPPQTESLPLSTNGRWIVNAASGHRVKLRCVSWAAHLESVLPEGLDRQPVRAITESVASLGFNCIRLTWGTYMWTVDIYANVTAAGQLKSLGLHEAAAGLAKHNPQMAHMKVRKVFEAVVKASAGAGLMVVLENHVSRPQTCCREDDGNGFFGDKYFNTEEWIRGLESVAVRFKGVPQVIGISLRNELRGPRESVSSWRENMVRGCKAILKLNPKLLVIVSGLHFGSDLNFLRQNRLGINFGNKLVYEIHTHTLLGLRPEDWAKNPLAPICTSFTKEFNKRAAFLNTGFDAAPLIVEFGGDQNHGSRSDDRFFSCLFGVLAERDFDWALWALQGSYYISDRKPNAVERVGVLRADWTRPRNTGFATRFRLLQQTLQVPEITPIVHHYNAIFHPASGRCLSVNDEGRALLRDCKKKHLWSHEPRQPGAPAPIRAVSTNAYLDITGEGKQVNITRNELSARWSIQSSLGFPFRIAGKNEGVDLCLESRYPKYTAVVAKKCTCLEGPTCSLDSQPQWFVFVSAQNFK